MSWFKDRLKKKIRTSTGQDEPFQRPEESERAKEIRSRTENTKSPFGYSDKEMDDINEARKKWLKEKAKKK